MDLDGTLYEKGSRWSGALASLVKRSVIKISRHRERERGGEERGSIDADSGRSVFLPQSIDVFSQLRLERAEERRGDGDVGGCVFKYVRVRKWLHSCVHIS